MHLICIALPLGKPVRKPKGRGLCLRAGPRLGPFPEASLAFMSRKTTLCFARGISLFKDLSPTHPYLGKAQFWGKIPKEEQRGREQG